MPCNKNSYRVRCQQYKANTDIKNPFVAPVLKFADGIYIDDVQITSRINRVAPDNRHAFRGRNFILHLCVLQGRHLVDDVLGWHIFGAKNQFINLVNVYYVFDL